MLELKKDIFVKWNIVVSFYVKVFKFLFVIL